VKNPYAAVSKRVSKTPGGVKQPPKKKAAAVKSRKSRQKASVVITVRKSSAKESRRMQGISNLPSGTRGAERKTKKATYLPTYLF
jgi:hypothetical protein